MKKPALLVFLELISCHTPTQPPVLNDTFAGEEYGCADFRIYRANESGNSILEIASRRMHQKDTSYSVDIRADSTVKVRIFRYDHAVDLKQAFCNDVGTGIQAIDTLNGVSGNLKIEVTDFKKGTIFNSFTVHVEGSGILVDGKEGGRRIDAFLIDSVNAGWLPG